MKTEEILNAKPEKYTGNLVKGIKKGSVVEITVKDGKFEAVVQQLHESLMIVTLLKPMTSSNAHSYHWDAGNLKSVLYNRILKLKNLNMNAVESIAA